MAYKKLVTLCRRQLKWLGLSEASRDVLALLLVESYWTGESLTPEEISDETGFSRGSISVALSQLSGLGFIDGQTDPKQKGRGRKRTKFTISEGLSGLIVFGIRKLRIDLEGIISELAAIETIVDSSDDNATRVIRILEEEASRNLTNLRDAIQAVLSSRAQIELETHKASK
ncbi:MAG: hypothetical protein ACFFEV_04205 [Candidatus Thorarchaeota archaeon]